MTHRERMMRVIRGEPVDRIPYCPRLDLWYNANRRAGTLPSKYRNASLFQIVDDCGFGFHGIVPHFKELRSPEDELHRGLGVYNLACMPCRTRFENVKVEYRQEGDELAVRYHTPHGDLTTRALHDEGMKKAGITISHLKEHAFKGPQDYKAIAWIFDNAEVESNEDGYRGFAEDVGERGIAAGFLSLAGSPMHLILRELMPFETFCFELFDHPDELARCTASIGGYFDRLFKVAAASSADLFLFGANYDVTLTNPDFFREHITPWLGKFAAMLHKKGKFLLTHTDGENTGLLDCFLESRIDVADSICPRPMTRLSIKEVRQAFGGRITIMGGVPSASLIRDAMADREFGPFMDNFFEEIGKGDRLILGISDTTPPAADFNRIIEIEKRIQAFGPVRI